MCLMMSDDPADPLKKREERKSIGFYGQKNDNAYLSNFFLTPIDVDGVVWPSVEHFFQAMKYPHDQEYQEAIRKTPKCSKAKWMGGAAGAKKNRKVIRSDWESVKEDIMHDIVLAKFQQNDEIKSKLIGTGDARLFENSPRDSFWGVGRGKKGKNKLGKILMRVRDELKEELE
eukprot:TRINITY_DN10426_c0_g2_i2.p1 TRINITY_DN10426_c0_g2~~TRINITY_DN10426_c0_g2_i2.p1  ORF type:complete len:173 (+),score=57.29 TRINITY_DN10426_c0_g2_i2:40-558(+)